MATGCCCETVAEDMMVRAVAAFVWLVFGCECHREDFLVFAVPLPVSPQLNSNSVVSLLHAVKSAR